MLLEKLTLPELLSNSCTKYKNNLSLNFVQSENRTYQDFYNEVIAVSTYAGKTVRAKAKCNPSDKFDIEIGKKLAAARLSAHVSRLRKQNAARLWLKSQEQFARAQQYLNKMSKYYFDACDEVEYTQAQLMETENVLKGE